jgi:hypothetical protein
MTKLMTIVALAVTLISVSTFAASAAAVWRGTPLSRSEAARASPPAFR